MNSANWNPTDARLHFARTDIVRVEDEIFSLRGDFEWTFSDDSVLRFGLDYINREKQNNALNNIATQCAFCGYGTTFATHGDATNLFLGNTPGNFLSGSSASIPRVFPKLNIAEIRAAYDTAAGGGVSALTPVPDPLASSTVEEAIFGAYAQADFTGEMFDVPYSANLGVRIANTDSESTGHRAEVESYTRVERVDTNNQNFLLGDNETESSTITNSYLDVLPSANIAWDIQENIILRAAFSKSLSRPTLTDLSTFFALTSTNVGGEAIVRSNPELEAIRSDNFDLSLEWYGDNGSFVGLAVFYKDISDFVTQVVFEETVTINAVVPATDAAPERPLGPLEFTFRIAEPRNGDTAEIYGLELGGQYIADAGFGVAANVTFADSEAISGGEKAPLENISDISANLSLFYEVDRLFRDTDTFSARISVNHRSDYLVGQTVEGGRNEFVDDFTQLDLAISYGITENLSLFIDGINITDEPFFRFSETRAFLESYEENGARWVFGIRGSF